MTLTLDEKSPFYEHDLKLMRKADAAFEKMMKELAMLNEYVEQDKLHLLEYKLSKNTRKIYNEIKHQNNTAFKKLLEEAAIEEAAADAKTPANPALDTGKNILGLINKFHQDNKDDIGLLSSDDTFKTSIPKNIGAEPGLLKKIAKRALVGKGSGLGQMAVNFLMSILTGAFQKMEKSFSQFKSDFLDAKKQGEAWKFIYSKVGVGMSVAKRKPDGTVEFVQDSSGPGLLNWIRDFLKANPKWTNLAIGLLINIAKAKAALIGVSLGASASGALAVGVIVGLVLRTLYGRLKGEDWNTAIKKAAIVTGLALIGGSITKGFFSLLKGGGFFDGAKEYFTTVPGAEAAANVVSDKAIDAKAAIYAKAIKGVTNVEELRKLPFFKEMAHNMALTQSSRSETAGMEKILSLFNAKDKLSDADIQDYIRKGMLGRLKTLTQQGIDPNKIFTNLNSTGVTQAASAAATEIDMDTLKMANVSGLASQLHKAFPADQPPTAESLLKFFSSKGLDPKIAKDLAKSITGGDSASAAERFRDLWRMGGASGDTVIFNKIKALATLPKDQYDKLLGSAGGGVDISDAAIDKELALQKAVQQSGGFKMANPEVAKQILAKAGLPSDATSEQVFSKGIKGVFGAMSMDPDAPFAESTNKLNRFMLEFIKEKASSPKELTGQKFFEYLSAKTSVPLEAIKKMADDEEMGASTFTRELTATLKSVAQNPTAGSEARNNLYGFAKDMMGTLAYKMQASPDLMKMMGANAADVAKQTAINQAHNAASQTMASAPQSLSSMGLDESIYKKLIKNLYL